VSGEGGFEMELEIGDLGVEQADVGDGSAHDRFQYFRGDGVHAGGCCSESADEFCWGLAASVAVSMAELTHPALGEERR